MVCSSWRHGLKSTGFVFLAVFMVLSFLKTSVLAQISDTEAFKNQLDFAPDSTRMKLHYDIASNFYAIPPSEVLEHVDSIIFLAGKLKSDLFHYRALYLKAVGYYLSGDFDKAEKVLVTVDSSQYFSDDLASLMDVYNLMGTILSSRDKMSSALNYQYQALEIAKNLGETDRQVTALCNIAQTYTDNLDTTKSKEYYESALAMAESISDTISIAVINNNLAGITRDPKLRLEYADRALVLFEKLSYSDGIAHAGNEKGLALKGQKLYAKALPYMRRSVSIWKENNYNQGLATAYTNLGVLHGYLSDMDSAKHYFDRAINLGHNLEDKMVLKGTFEEIARMYEDIDQEAQAYIYLKKATELKDVLYSQERAEQLARAETDFQTREKEQRLVEQQLTIAQQKNVQKNVIVVASLIVLLLLGGFQYLRFRNQIRRKDADLALKLEKAEAEKLRDLDRLKTDFFTNISHEFRTPLTLIQTPLKQAIKTSAGNAHVTLPEDQALVMNRSTEQLLHLVNQVLDLAKLEEGKMQLAVRNGDLALFIRSIGYGFESLAMRKQINYRVDVPNEPVMAWYDREKVGYILSNLIGNAFKYTPEGGRISLETMFADDSVEIFVRDSGVGIAPQALPRIFDRFFSGKENGLSGESSSGVGLALTKELVVLHKGEIHVDSIEQSGSTFHVWLPIAKHYFSDAQVQTGIVHDLASPILGNGDNIRDSIVNQMDQVDDPLTDQKPLILVVEDNSDLRNYISGELKSIFQVDTANNGYEGLMKAMQMIPDLIITDVMMPEMDGTELCRQLRQKVETSHIPIIMLTAKADREGKMEGLEVGADDYLTKPFDHEELIVRAKNLIQQRRLLRRRFASDVIFKPNEVASNSIDEAFLTNVLQVIEKNMEDPSFSVEDLAKDVSLSRSQLHRKLKALADQSPNELIRSFRLQRAHDLLLNNAGNMSEVAYQVGFNSLSYFSKCFKDQFGLAPSEILSKG
ncbi:MAG: response regulator [Saprospiraceae bacterium]|nr:response regulator [Saprospiraceae bacterium]